MVGRYVKELDENEWSRHYVRVQAGHRQAAGHRISNKGSVFQKLGINANYFFQLQRSPVLVPMRFRHSQDNAYQPAKSQSRNDPKHDSPFEPANDLSADQRSKNR
jgi:hypothetical protein